MAKNEKAVEKKGKDKGEKKGFFASVGAFFGRIGKRLKETFSELKNVTWPTIPKALKATGVVIVIVLIFLVIVTAINLGLTELLKLLTSLGAA